MKIIRTVIPDILIIEPTVFHDERGWFMESFNEERFNHELTLLGLPLPGPFVQDNHSSSERGCCEVYIIKYSHMPRES